MSFFTECQKRYLKSLESGTMTSTFDYRQRAVMRESLLTAVYEMVDDLQLFSAVIKLDRGFFSGAVCRTIRREIDEPLRISLNYEAVVLMDELEKARTKKSRRQRKNEKELL